MYPAPAGAGAGDTDWDSETVSRRLGSSRRSSQIFAHTLKLHLGDRRGRSWLGSSCLSENWILCDKEIFSVCKVAQNLNETDQWCFKIQNPLWIITIYVLQVPAPVSTLSPDHAWPGHFTSACSLLAVQLYYSTMGGRTGPLSRRDTRGTRQSSTQQWRSLQRDWQNCSETFEHLVTKKREMSIRTNRLSVRFKMWRLIFDLFSETVWCAAAPPTNYKLSYVIVYQSSESENIKLQSRAESWNRNSSTITQTILGATCTR